MQDDETLNTDHIMDFLAECMYLVENTTIGYVED